MRIAARDRTVKDGQVRDRILTKLERQLQDEAYALASHAADEVDRATVRVQIINATLNVDSVRRLREGRRLLREALRAVNLLLKQLTRKDK